MGFLLPQVIRFWGFGVSEVAGAPALGLSRDYRVKYIDNLGVLTASFGVLITTGYKVLGVWGLRGFGDQGFRAIKRKKLVFVYNHSLLFLILSKLL